MKQALLTQTFIIQFLGEGKKVFLNEELIESFDKAITTDLAHTFKDKALLLNAFTHKSFAHEYGNDLPNNETLEFLGDAAIDLFISECLMDLYPEHPEGKLSKIRSSIVNGESLAKIAQSLEMDKLILLGKGEFKEGGSTKPKLLANIYEALIGAIYKDGGFEAAKMSFAKHLTIYEKMTGENLLSDKILEGFDAKSKLQEIVMKEFKETPVYKSKDLNGKFEVSVCVKGETLVTLENISKKKGMQLAAQQVLNNNLLTQVKR